MRQMHLCGFLIAGPVCHSHAIWRNPMHNVDFLDLDFYLSLARTLERGKFDLVFFADRLGISDRYGLNLEVGIKYGDQDATRLDPVPILGAMAVATRYLGLGATRSTTYEQPYHVAREFATLDHLSGGRAAWNVVTSMHDGEALNFGIDAHLEHDQRYDRADEFVELTYKLWSSWDDDALVLDKGRGQYADPNRVHYVNHEGRWFRSRGPLNIPTTPQRRPVVIQAGSSGRGTAFAARWADVIFTIQPTPEQMKRFYDDVHAQLVSAGRGHEDCKILPAIMPFVGHTHAAAEGKRNEHNALIHPLVGLATLSSHSNIDFSTHRLDEPIAAVQSTGTQGLFAAVMRLTQEQGLTLADIGRLYGRGVLVPQVVGTATEIADYMEALVAAQASDGFVISPAFLPESFEEFVEQVVPELQRRGIFRQEYSGRRLRDHLGLATPRASSLR